MITCMYMSESCIYGYIVIYLYQTNSIQYQITNGGYVEVNSICVTCVLNRSIQQLVLKYTRGILIGGIVLCYEDWTHVMGCEMHIHRTAIISQDETIIIYVRFTLSSLVLFASVILFSTFYINEVISKFWLFSFYETRR